MRINSISKIKNIGKNFHVLYERMFNKPLPKFLAKIIAYFNKKDLNKKLKKHLELKTYDGSNQVVHPDFLEWKNKIWLVCTPYPYGCNKCENPSVFCGNKLDKLFPACNNPIDFPSSEAVNSILCDPCFFEVNEKLCICYRERIQGKDNVKYNLYVKTSSNGVEWQDKKLIFSTNTSDEDPLISPAVIKYGSTNYIYHIKAKEYGGRIIVAEMGNNFDIKNSKILECKGLPKNFFIWHIGLHSENYNKCAKNGEKILGLFTVRNGFENRVYKAHQNSPETSWIIDEEIDVPKNIRGECRTVYKCSYLPNGGIALSFFDNKNRLVIVYI